MTDNTHYPRGQLNEEDRGELSLALLVRDGEVILRFGKPIAWFGLGKSDVAALCRHIEQHAASAAQSGREGAPTARPEPMLSIENNTVRVDFKPETAFVCMTPERARRFVKDLRELARELTSTGIEAGPR
jgi:hypothetical protein